MFVFCFQSPGVHLFQCFPWLLRLFRPLQESALCTELFLLPAQNTGALTREQNLERLFGEPRVSRASCCSMAAILPSISKNPGPLLCTDLLVPFATPMWSHGTMHFCLTTGNWVSHAKQCWNEWPDFHNFIFLQFFLIERAVLNRVCEKLWLKAQNPPQYIHKYTRTRAHTHTPPIVFT